MKKFKITEQQLSDVLELLIENPRDAALINTFNQLRSIPTQQEGEQEEKVNKEKKEAKK